MKGSEKILGYIQKIVPLTQEEEEQFYNAFRPLHVKKRQFIIQPNFPVRQRNYVVDGAFRGYVIDEAGIDHTIQFAVEDWWISDYNSYIFQKPATMFVVALEDSLVLELTYEKEQELKRSNHKFETFFRVMAERSGAFFQKRIISSLTLSAEQRYNEFLATYPSVVQRLPQYAVASYLGMTTEFLSRIRNKKTKKKS
ncbi:Crp/Fnr family transcriptional regulator [Panacibacter ginsenosidivorans]|uniref:Crp/Fnr family transcriptional regulator n=1 Tax=Panacibacter ginsenosidivorans TaxID=1813871 RepID=A0A5B8VF27_9BACT|nr:Crp/Fnr family transcriptional regulator [Panacibacter ginsenosidivorans]QEC69621.1 Crp/Fnr family transcriptional regulator [Panacibacter ginsenosidivorans]